jgi:inner membrane protein
VIADHDSYHFGEFNWLSRPRVSWDDRRIPMGERDATVIATLQLQQVRDYLRWSRFPFVTVRADGDGHEVRFGDARYPSGMRGALGGITVRVDGMTARRIVD